MMLKPLLSCYAYNHKRFTFVGVCLLMDLAPLMVGASEPAVTSKELDRWYEDGCKLLRLEKVPYGKPGRGESDLANWRVRMAALPRVETLSSITHRPVSETEASEWSLYAQKRNLQTYYRGVYGAKPQEAALNVVFEHPGELSEYYECTKPWHIDEISETLAQRRGAFTALYAGQIMLQASNVLANAVPHVRLQELLSDGKLKQLEPALVGTRAFPINSGVVSALDPIYLASCGQIGVGELTGRYNSCYVAEPITIIPPEQNEEGPDMSAKVQGSDSPAPPSVPQKRMTDNGQSRKKPYLLVKDYMAGRYHENPVDDQPCLLPWIFEENSGWLGVKREKAFRMKAPGEPDFMLRALCWN